ncbi:hypothetical protein BDA96_05G192700 [Sorghum bicolor]|uniref:Uncharacterized protein n=2 Tax=Sorghum bicolor TaxID=4558 RepID=A0A921QZQ0_SORBI|nr:uncharacterized protein LOC8066686 isoform X1 [Sorghum bicolor]KAG0530509.1 hypothetical protein BDA96_05G192700 [Sorghum bicolor]KXG28866.1 hypothetical protein SORBI_3005G176800 [Sorghum bicolor]|eukprot:XP_021316625.1 uncharacterized protein LOC8066686 isoform X1 [Sorghum bicolor]
MDMAEDGLSKKVSSLLEKKDAANEDPTAIRKEVEETNSTQVDKMETLASQEPREYMSQNKTTLASMVKEKIRKILGKAKPRKKRTTKYPIIGAVLKFHKDDDVYPADSGLQQLHNKEM